MLTIAQTLSQMNWSKSTLLYYKGATLPSHEDED